MQWEAEAENALKKVPIFVRKMVRKKVEEYAADKGCTAVTLAEVEEARRAFKQGGGAESVSAAETIVEATAEQASVREVVSFDDGNITSERIQRLETLSDKQGLIKTNFSILKVCGAPFGCPRQVLNPGSLWERLAERIEKIGYREWLEERVEGPILTHHKFRVALAGCPNACSQPQIQDFGVIARAIPEKTLEPCIECMECVAACREDSIEVADAEPIIDYAKCVGCSDCARACPTGTLVAERRGYSIVIGGRLGRHPQFAQEIMHLASEKEVELALEACLELYMKNAEGEERFTLVFNRLGLEAFRQAVEERIRYARV